MRQRDTVALLLDGRGAEGCPSLGWPPQWADLVDPSRVWGAFTRGSFRRFSSAFGKYRFIAPRCALTPYGLREEANGHKLHCEWQGHVYRRAVRDAAPLGAPGRS